MKQAKMTPPMQAIQRVFDAMGKDHLRRAVMDDCSPVSVFIIIIAKFQPSVAATCFGFKDVDSLKSIASSDHETLKFIPRQTLNSIVIQCIVESNCQSSESQDFVIVSLVTDERRVSSTVKIRRSNFANGVVA